MAFKVENLEDLDRAIATGADRIKYQDRETELRSLKDMLRIRRLIEIELGIKSPNRSARLTSSYSKGLR